MKAALCALIFTALLCLLMPTSIMAQEGNIYVYGFSGITYDQVNHVARGTSYTELDYNTEAYYTPYVCGELHTDGVQRVRACGGGIHRATRYTSYTSNPDTIYLLSDHYVDITYQDDPYSSYIDYYGYGFLLSSNYPNSYYYYPPEIYNTRDIDSINLGSTMSLFSLILAVMFGIQLWHCIVTLLMALQRASLHAVYL